MKESFETNMFVLNCNHLYLGKMTIFYENNWDLEECIQNLDISAKNLAVQKS